MGFSQLDIFYEFKHLRAIQPSSKIDSLYASHFYFFFWSLFCLFLRWSAVCFPFLWICWEITSQRIPGLYFGLGLGHIPFSKIITHFIGQVGNKNQTLIQTVAVIQKSTVFPFWWPHTFALLLLLHRVQCPCSLSCSWYCSVVQKSHKKVKVGKTIHTLNGLIELCDTEADVFKWIRWTVSVF